jgi:hypothetical protein
MHALRGLGECIGARPTGSPNSMFGQADRMKHASTAMRAPSTCGPPGLIDTQLPLFPTGRVLLSVVPGIETD